MTGNVHGTPGATEAPLREMVRVAAVVVSVPLHVGVEESATLKPAGKVSLKPTPANVAVLFVLLIVNVKVDVLPCAIDVGLNPLLIEGGDSQTHHGKGEKGFHITSPLRPLGLVKF